MFLSVLRHASDSVNKRKTSREIMKLLSNALMCQCASPVLVDLRDSCSIIIQEELRDVPEYNKQAGKLT